MSQSRRLAKFPYASFYEPYPNGAAIDTTGEYRGQTFSSPADIRIYLSDHPDLLAHNLAHRLLTYALGRSLGFADQPALSHFNVLLFAPLTKTTWNGTG